MSLKTFIQTDILLPRLRQHGVLVVYDPERRYRDLCLELVNERRAVVDAGESSIVSRAAALAALQKLGEPNTPLEGLLVYVPAAKPLTDEAKQRDPFSLYAACGALFPDGDGDEYLNLCLKAKPDHAPEIRRIFDGDPNPPFAVIDAVGAGAGWPTLQATLHVESARDILFALLAPSDVQARALRGRDAWLAEAKALCQASLGLTPLTRGRSWDLLAAELWRFLLWSELAFDLPGEPPASLAGVPRAPDGARPLVEGLCERLRNDQRTVAAYLSRAEEVEQTLDLPARCRDLADLGSRATFPFQERASFAAAVHALEGGDLDAVRVALARHAGSVWAGRGESQTQWQMLEAAAGLIQACEDRSRHLSEHSRSLDALLDFYLGSLHAVDRAQREFEAAAGDLLDPAGELAAAASQARRAYRRLADQVQGLFLRHLARSGWPPAGRLANADLFDRLVAPRLSESGRRVALLLIDALRYELGLALHTHLVGAGHAGAEIQPAFAQLPTITPVGMASLLPGAGQALRLLRRNDQMTPALGEQVLTSVTQRMAVLRARYGQRFAEATLRDFLQPAFELPGTAELLVLRSNEMDRDFENNPEAAPGLLSRTFQQVRQAARKLAELGFDDALIVTDHGFFLNPETGAGDACARPPGNWLAVHERLLLGDGAEDAANALFDAAALGMRGDFGQAASPRAMTAYRAGATYLHGGVSLQEAVAPVITVPLRQAEPAATLWRPPAVTLSYKQGAKRITTRLPVIDISAGLGELGSAAAPVELLLEAQDRQGNVVGEARPGGPVNPATRLVSLPPGQSARVTVQMQLDFEGKFSVKALDPTTLALLDKLDLETDYTV